MNGKHPQLKDLLGNYHRTKNNQSINHWINENTKVINKNEYNAGIWKDVETNHWCIGYIDKNIDNLDDCKNYDTAWEWTCYCKFRNPSIAICPEEKNMLAWEVHRQDKDLKTWWEKLKYQKAQSPSHDESICNGLEASEYLQIKPKQGINMNIFSE